MVTLNGLQVDETTNSQPPLVVLPLINHSVNMSGENLSRLQKNGLITPPQLSIDAKRPLNRGGGNNFFNGVAHGRPLQSQTTAPAPRAAPRSLGYVGFSRSQHDSIINEPRNWFPLFGYMTRNSAGQGHPGQVRMTIGLVFGTSDLTRIFGCFD
jgi:hypothetical protein